MIPSPVTLAAAKGWSVIPLRLNKKPALDRWKPYQTAKPTPEELATWSEKAPPAWAVITGAVSGIVILDFDGEHGKETMRRLGLRPHVRTGSGGYHVYFPHPGHYVQTLNSKAKIELGKRYPGLDIRADGGYAAFTGRNESGEYKWLRSAEPDSLDTIPADLRAFLGLDAPAAASGKAPTPAPSGESPRRSAPAADTSNAALIERAVDRARQEGRNNAGFWLACQLRDRELSEADAEGYLRDYAARVPQTNTKGQHEPYTIAEAQASLREAYARGRREPPRNPNRPAARVSAGANAPAPPAPAAEAPPEEAPERFNRTDLGNALRLRKKFGRFIRYCHAWEQWLIWDGRRWALDQNGQIRRYAHETARAILAEAAECADSDERRALTKWSYDTEGTSRLRAMVAECQSLQGIAITPADLDSDGLLLNCNNGTIDLRTGTLRPHRRADHITKLAPVDFDPAAPAPVFEMFVRQLMCDRPALVEYLQRAIGYSITGAVSEKALFLFYGGGDNGKTTLLESIRAAIGDYAGIIPIEALMATKGATGREATPELAELKGKRFVTSSEADDGQRLNEARVKHLTGMGRIIARSLYKDPFEFEPTHKLFIDANYKPNVRGQDKGIWTRIKLIPFDLRLNDQQKDRTLPERLREEAPGILAWCVRGTLAWLASGLQEPAEVTEAVSGYRAQMDVLGRFVEDCTRPDEGAIVRASDLYKVYSAWAKEAGEFAWSERVFAERMTERGHRRQRKTAGSYYLDMVLVQEIDSTGKLKPCRDVGSCSDFGWSFPQEAQAEESFQEQTPHPTSLHDAPAAGAGEWEEF